ncbi:MAG TPA: hypothetical protein VIJ75_16990 [Hanamia sp.]
MIKTVKIFSIVALIILKITNGNAQTLYPDPVVNESYVSSSPEAQAMENYGTTPTTLYLGLPAINVPLYQISCGSLSMPISLNYDYNGLYPLQDASWVGLGWSLNAGGVITRTIEGYADSSQNSGYNYGQYNIIDTLFTSYNYNNFLQNAYNNNLSYAHKSYDMAPDIFDCEFYNGSGKFFWYNGKAYQLSYDKQIGISWPSNSGSITITTAEGTTYTFGAKDTTTINVYGGPIYAPLRYFSAWHLSMVVSADKKDTISLTYVPYNWQQNSVSYQTSYTLSTGVQADLGNDPNNYYVNPVTVSQVLQSIRCRNTRVNFIPESREDLNTNYPGLQEIDVIDSLSGNIVKRNKFSYEYFGPGGDITFERLKLKRVNSINTQLTGDSLTYTFKYASEYANFPSKATQGFDYWGFYNGQDTNETILPAASTGNYYPIPPGSATIGSSNSMPYFNYCSYGALDTIVYPAGGYSVFTYEQNSNVNNSAGPGICLQSITNYNNNSSMPSLQKKYSYLLDSSTLSSGINGSPPVLSGVPFSVNDGTNTYNYTNYNASFSSQGSGALSSLFYYQKVSETMISGNETHRSDHYFQMFPGAFLDVRQTKEVDYINKINTNIFTPVTKTITSYNTVNDTSFYSVYPYISQENYNKNQHPPITYTYAYGFGYNSWSTNWTFPSFQETVQYDQNGDSIVNTVNFNFNTTTRNLASAQQSSSDGQTITQKFKYPEDYTTNLTGNMITSRVLSPIIEKESWLKQDSNDSLLISGIVTMFDQTIFKPTSTYSIETTSPIRSLNNETKSGSLYSSILSDSRYILKGSMQYDANNNLSVAAKANDLSTSYLWDYNHSEPIAEVKNAAQADIAYTSFEADGKGNWAFTGAVTADVTSPTGNNCYNIGQASGSITKSGLSGSSTYTVSYWIKNSSTPLTIAGTVSGYPIKGKTINNWTYFEHKITGQSSVNVSGTGTLYIDELRLYPYNAQMVTFTYTPLIGKSSECDGDNRISYYQYDGFGRLKVVLDQDHNIIKTIHYHSIGETAE